eukprot:TRINITY_DN27122_c0_g1_i1.p1 TRINITY_DN27122_c0_g1~~TRINITY_DN27122_c0_g1_i1.p1  ORF type:complete len:498 (-),score=131.98 TRINITY_DN27122_c0_g1_i1:293-1786(-)
MAMAAAATVLPRKADGCGTNGYVVHDAKPAFAPAARALADPRPTGGEEAQRLAAFAAGCLGVQTPQAVGKKLGLMGNATLQEYLDVLRYLECLHLQRAAKLAGLPNPGAALTGTPAGENSEGSRQSPDAAAVAAAGIGERFEADLLHAVRASSLCELYRRLPQDGSGLADLCSVFGVKPSPSNASRAEKGAQSKLPDASDASPNAAATEGGGLVAFTSEYTEQASELPPVSEAVLQLALSRLLGSQEPGGAVGAKEEERWEVDTSAVNALRSALVPRDGCSASGSLLEALREPGKLLHALAPHCPSRRPALAKAALHCLAELAAEAISGTDARAKWSPVEPSDADALREAFSGCLAAAKSTKMVARVAEGSLAALVQRLAADASAPAAAMLVATCTMACVRAKPAQPPAVAAGLKVLLAPLAAALAKDEGRGASDGEALAESRAAVHTLCEEVLASRALGASFAAARSLSKAVPKPTPPAPPEVAASQDASSQQTAA